MKNITPDPTAMMNDQERWETLIPKPVSLEPGEGSFHLTSETKIYYPPNFSKAASIGEFLAEKFRRSTGFALPVLPGNGEKAAGNIYFALVEGDPALGEEGYTLTITGEHILLAAQKPAGLFWGVQTLRQLMPAAIESSTAVPGSWTVACGTIRDYPRYSWRGMMLDVSRHFFSVEDVKKLIDNLVYYKINRFHMHISDDQGWRLMINSWPNLAEHGGSTQVGGGRGGYYTQEEYVDLVHYAQARFVTIVPEIDMPGHTNAALASYPELNCNGIAPNLYTGTEVGFSSLCVGKEITFKFLDDVIGEIAQLTPGAYLHVGGDEAAATPADEYRILMERVQTIVQAHGKQVIGWEEISQVELLPTTVAQYWSSGKALEAVKQGNKVIMSPAPKIYIDMKYDESTPYGLTWAGIVEVSDAYRWDPATQLSGISEADILGVEAPLWAETLETLEQVEYMVFPRLNGVAEIGWSPAEGRDWDEYKVRLGAHAPRMKALQINFYPSSQVPWKK